MHPEMALLFIVNLFAITPKFNQKTENICPIAFEKISLFIQPLADASLFETPSLHNFNCSFGFSFSRDQTTKFGLTIRLLPHCFPTLPNISSSVLAKLLWFVCLLFVTLKLSCYPYTDNCYPFNTTRLLTNHSSLP